MTDTTKRDVVLKKFYERSYKKTDGWRELDDLIMDAMADHIVELEATAERAERILVALREPSKEVWGAALEAYNNAPFATHTPRLIRALLAAVTAAEKEVGHD